MAGGSGTCTNDEGGPNFYPYDTGKCVVSYAITTADVTAGTVTRSPTFTYSIGGGASKDINGVSSFSATLSAPTVSNGNFTVPLNAPMVAYDLSNLVTGSYSSIVVETFPSQGSLKDNFYRGFIG